MKCRKIKRYLLMILLAIVALWNLPITAYFGIKFLIDKRKKNANKSKNGAKNA